MSGLLTASHLQENSTPTHNAFYIPDKIDIQCSHLYFSSNAFPSEHELSFRLVY